MNDKALGVVETRFAKMIWECEPIASGDLVRLCEKELCWKKSTTYTVLKKLCERGLFRNDGGIVTSVVSQQEYYAAQSTQFVEHTFDGSLPAFVAAFASRKPLSSAEVEELRHMIDKYGEG